MERDLHDAQQILRMGDGTRKKRSCRGHSLLQRKLVTWEAVKKALKINLGRLENKTRSECARKHEIGESPELRMMEGPT